MKKIISSADGFVILTALKQILFSLRVFDTDKETVDLPPRNHLHANTCIYLHCNL
jgi:hypothetical protein